jgi:hypothetical protein
MDKRRVGRDQADANAHKPYEVRLPGFMTDGELGLGDVITRATSAAGIRPCGACGRRAAALNRWMVFSGRRTK